LGVEDIPFAALLCSETERCADLERQ